MKIIELLLSKVKYSEREIQNALMIDGLNKKIIVYNRDILYHKYQPFAILIIDFNNKLTSFLFVKYDGAILTVPVSTVP